MFDFKSSFHRQGYAVPGACLIVAAAIALAATTSFRSMRPRSLEVPNVAPVAYWQDEGIPNGLDGGVDWINTGGAIHLENLRGKVVLLDFWTYCCINCHHVLPDLAKLEEEFKDNLVVIGVHTPKFPAERETENIRKKVREYRIKHPVVNDANQVIWNRFGVRSWPTLVLIDAKGNYVGSAPGEGNYQVLHNEIAKLIRNHKAAKELSGTHLKFFPEIEKPHNSPLMQPGKILADGEGGRLFISDTGHNRIVVVDMDGKAQAVIGDGGEGLKDGDFDHANFNRPQGMALIGETLYVADTENHAIRACDLKAKTVTTVAGNGKQSRKRIGGGPAKEFGLNSPWDVCPVPGMDNALFVAMAGIHEIWRLNLKEKEKEETVAVWAGTGAEDVRDGAAESAAFGQPSGLATDGKHLYVADSEGSAVRAIALVGARRVSTLAGTHDLAQGQSLFAFGDHDGPGPQARLQHCLGLAYGGGKLYIADSYNNKIRVCDLKTKEVETLVGEREPGSTDKPAKFDEPGGISLAGTNLYIADTNNHLIRVVDVKTKRTHTLKLDGLKAPTLAVRPPKFLNATTYNQPAVKIKPGDAFSLDVALKLPDDFKLNREEPMPYLLETPGQTGVLGESASPSGGSIESPSNRFTVSVPLAKTPEVGQTFSLKFSIATFQCKSGANGVCTVKSYSWKIPIEFADAGQDRIELTNAKPKAE